MSSQFTQFTHFVTKDRVNGPYAPVSAVDLDEEEG